LSSLDLSENDIGDAGAGALSASGWFAHLSELSLAGNGVTELGARALSGAAWIGSLGALDLSDNPIGDGFELLAPRLSVRELRIARTGIDAPLEILPQLVELDASGSRTGAEALARMRGIRRLALRDVELDPSSAGLLACDRESLDLAGNALTMAALMVLASASLERLDLSRTGIGDAGVALLARSPTMSSLRSIHLVNDGMTPDGLEALLASERTDRLAAIDLSDNPLGPEGARLLAESKLLERLTRIRARNCGFTPEGIQILRDKIENCRC
jgi:Ran GTPase-activating protein (RanGAP) involved in mRNA processing and transport